MSSFIVQDETINRVVSYFYLMQMGNRHCSGAWKLQQSGYNVTTEEGQRKLAQEMADLNQSAYDGRYKIDGGDQPPPFPYRFTLNGATRIQALKHLQCWQYQCSEEATYQTDLFKLMNEVIGLMACDIVRDLDSYQAAEYDARI